MGQGEVAVWNLDRGMSFAAELPHRFQQLGHPPAIVGMAIAKTAAIGVERQGAGPRDEVPIGNEAPALALLAKAEVFKLYHDGNGEAVVDRGVFDVGGQDAGFFEGTPAGPDAGTGADVVKAAHLMLDRFARTTHPDRRSRKVAGDFRARDDDSPPAIADDATIQPVQRIRDNR